MRVVQTMIRTMTAVVIVIVIRLRGEIQGFRIASFVI